MQNWTGHVAVVTGGASGLGAATGRALRDQGMQIAIFDLNDDVGQAKATELDGLFVRVDVSDPSSVAAGFAKVAADLGTPRVVVNCAGIAPASKTVSRGEAHDPAMFQKTIAINLIGSFLCASEGAKYMVAADAIDEDGGRGVIINTASVAAYEGQVGQVAYAASKAGVAGMTLPMARDLADKGVRVCAIAPGLFLTPMLAGMPEEVQTSLGSQVPFPSRLGHTAEYAALVSHIVTNSMLNGEVIRLDGAIRMAPR